MAIVIEKQISPREYGEIEERSETRSEFYRGEMFAMVGASWTHSLIVTNILRRLAEQLEDGPCAAVPNDMRVKIDSTGLYTYPDIVIVCGRPEFDDEVPNTVRNPIVLIEVFFPSTEAYDRGTKFDHYRRLPSLREYLLVAQDRRIMERFSRTADDRWIFDDAKKEDDTLSLESIGCTLRLSDVYAKVDFTTSETSAPPPDRRSTPES